MSNRCLPPAASRAAGFTILELMVSASVFGVILLVIAYGVLSFSDSYYKGVTSSKTQAVARAIMNDLVQSIQFGQDVRTGLSGGGGAQGVCIDNTLYSYVVGQEVVDSSPNGSKHQAFHGLIASSTGCGTPTVPNSSSPLTSGSRELLGPDMRLSALDVSQSGSLYTVHVRVISGDDDVLNPVPGGSPNWGAELCSSNIIGGKFCAVSDLSTTVEQRLL